MKRFWIFFFALIMAVSLTGTSRALGEQINVTYGDRLDMGTNVGYLYFRFAPEPYPPAVSRQAHIYHYKDSISGESGFCLHPRKMSAEGLMEPKAFYSYFPKTVLQRLEIAVAIGFYDGMEGFMDENLRYMFTQRYIWETIPVEYYGSNPDFLGTMGTATVTWRHLSGEINRSFNELYAEWKAQLEEEVDAAFQIPEFATQSLLLKIDETQSLQDKNQRLQYYTVQSAPEGVHVRIVGNELEITATEDASDGKIVLAHATFQRGVSFVYESENDRIQDLGIFRVSAPLETTIAIEVDKHGLFELTKTGSDQTLIPGVEFALYKDSTFHEEVFRGVTDAKGKLLIDSLREGRYYLRETKTVAPYFLDESTYAIDIQSGEKTERTLTNEEVRGQIILTKKDASDGSVLAGCVFSIKKDGREMERLTTDAQGKATSGPLSLGEYTITEITAPKGYSLSTEERSVSLRYEDDKTPIVLVEMSIEDERLVRPLLVHKESIIDLAIPLSGGSFELYCLESFYLTSAYKEGEPIATLSSEDGKITLPAVEPGRYALVETEAPEGYEINPAGIELALSLEGEWTQLARNGTPLYQSYLREVEKLNTLLEMQGGGHEPFDVLPFVEMEGTVFYNAPVLSRIQLSKHLEDNEWLESEEKSAECGIEFRIENAAGETVDRMITAENGFATSTLLPPGKYRLVQETVSDGYAMIEPFEIELADQVLTLRLENAPLLSSIQLVKIDAVTKEAIAQSGMRFSLYREESGGEPIAMKVTYPQIETLTEFTTDETGTLSFPEKLPFGTYWLEEREGPHGYFLDPDEGRIEITIDAPLTVIEVENIPQTGVFELEKYGEQFIGWKEQDQHGYTVTLPVFESRFLKGARFVLEKDGEVVREFATEDQVSRIEGLELGTYILREIEAPPGYLKDDTEYTLVFTPQAPDQRFHMQSKSLTNVKQKAEFRFLKELEPSLFLGVEGLEEVLFGLYSSEEMMGMPSGTLMGISKVNDKGEGSFEALLEGKYSVRELATHEAYVLSEEELPVRFSFSEEDGEVRVFSVEVEKNELKRSYLRVLKVEKGDGKALAGATFVIEAEVDGERISLGEAVSDDLGEVAWEFAYGKYFIREKEAPEGYRKTTDEWSIEIKGEEELELSWENEPTVVTIGKMDHETNKPLQAGFHILSGDKVIKFTQSEGIYRPDTSGEHLLMSNADGSIRIETLPSGDYTLEEVLVPDGYIRADNISFTLEEEIDLHVTNKMTSLKIKKVDKESGAGLKAGFVIRRDGEKIYFRQENNIYYRSEDGSDVLDTGKGGTLIIRGLTPGTYTIEETDVPKGYMKPEVITFALRDELEMKIENEPVPRLPATGDQTQLALRSASVLIILGVLVFLWKSKSAQ